MRLRSQGSVFALLLTLLFAAVSLSEARAQGSKPNQTLLKAQTAVGYVTAYVNGKKVGRWGTTSAFTSTKGSFGKVDISPYVKPGNNTLKVVWDSPKSLCSGSVEIAHATQTNQFRDLADITVGPMQKPTGERTVTFVVPNAAGVIGQTAGQTGARPRMGSGANQTRLSVSVAKGSLTVFVNEKKVGSYDSGYVPLDISNYVRGGENTLRVVRTSDNAVGTVSVAFAASPNQFRKLAEYQFTVLNKESGKTLSFNLPDAASR